MVLSNKKLKERLRTVKAASISVGNRALGSEVVVEQATNFDSKELQLLLDTRRKHQSKSSKRERKRKSSAAPGSNLPVAAINNNVVSKKKRKRKARDSEWDSQKENAKRTKRTKNKTKENEKSNNAAKDDTLITKEESQIEEIGTTKVYAGGVPYYSTEDDIRSYFEGCGTITDIYCMTFPDSGKFRGIAIISFKTEAAAKRALELDGSDMGGFFLKLRPYNASRSSNFQAEVVEGYKRIYVGNLSWDITEDDVRKCFSECKIASVRFGVDKETGVFKGYAHVDFSDNASVLTALKLNQKVVCGRPIKISCAIPKKEGNVAPLGASTGNDVALNEAPVPAVIEAPVVATTNEVGVSEEPVVSGKIRRRTCLECGQKGHLYANCPNKTKGDAS